MLTTSVMTVTISFLATKSTKRCAGCRGMNKTFVPLFVRKSRESSYSKLLEVVWGLLSFAGIKITFETGNRSILFLQMQNTSMEDTMHYFLANRNLTKLKHNNML